MRRSAPSIVEASTCKGSILHGCLALAVTFGRLDPRTITGNTDCSVDIIQTSKRPARPADGRVLCCGVLWVGALTTNKTRRISIRQVSLPVHFTVFANYYRAMHFSAYARSWDRMSSVRPSVRPSVTLVDCDHIRWKSWKLITRTTSLTPSLFVAKMRST